MFIVLCLFESLLAHHLTELCIPFFEPLNNIIEPFIIVKNCRLLNAFVLHVANYGLKVLRLIFQQLLQLNILPRRVLKFNLQVLDLLVQQANIMHFTLRQTDN